MNEGFQHMSRPNWWRYINNNAIARDTNGELILLREIEGNDDWECILELDKRDRIVSFSCGGYLNLVVTESGILYEVLDGELWPSHYDGAIRIHGDSIVEFDTEIHTKYGLSHKFWEIKLNWDEFSGDKIPKLNRNWVRSNRTISPVVEQNFDEIRFNYYARDGWNWIVANQVTDPDLQPDSWVTTYKARDIPGGDGDEPEETWTFSMNVVDYCQVLGLVIGSDGAVYSLRDRTIVQYIQLAAKPPKTARIH